MMIHTGSEALAADGKAFSLLGAFENTTVGISLVIGGSSAVAMSTLLIFLSVRFLYKNTETRGLQVLNLC